MEWNADTSGIGCAEQQAGKTIAGSILKRTDLSCLRFISLKAEAAVHGIVRDRQYC